MMNTRSQLTLRMVFAASTVLLLYAAVNGQQSGRAQEGFTSQPTARLDLGSAFPRNDAKRSFATVGLTEQTSAQGALSKQVDDVVEMLPGDRNSSNGAGKDSDLKLGFKVDQARFRWNSYANCQVTVLNSSSYAALIEDLRLYSSAKSFVAETDGIQDQGFWLGPGESKSYSVELRPASPARVKQLAKAILTPSALVRETPIQIQARYSMYTPDKQTLIERRQSEETVQVPFQPPQIATLLGCVVGALLITLLIYAHDNRFEGFGRLLTDILSGSVASIIAVLLLKYVRGYSLPISVEVNDFYGGIIVGLLSRKLVQTLYELLVPRKQTKNAGAKRASSARSDKRNLPAVGPRSSVGLAGIAKLRSRHDIVEDGEVRDVRPHLVGD